MAVVVGYAPTAEGRAALARAVTEATRRRSGLVVVDSRRSPAGGRRGDDGQQDEVERDVAEACRQVRDAGLPCEVRPRTGAVEAAEDVLAAAGEVSAELVVIGLRRRTPVGKLVLGSNAQRILLEAPCPVLAVKGRPSS